MKKSLLFSAAAGLFALTGSAFGSLILTNGGFETGDLTGWNVATAARWSVMGSDVGALTVNPIDTKMVRNAVSGGVQADSIWQIVDVTGATSGAVTLTLNAVRQNGTSGGGWNTALPDAMTVYGLTAGYTLDATGVPTSGFTNLIATNTPALAQSSDLPGNAISVASGSVAPFSTYLVRFQTLTGRNVYIDNVNLDVPGATAVAVPEPAALSLMGLTGLLLLRRSKK